MTSNTIYHYVYRITNLVEKKHYYGKRSSKIEPKHDLGKKYFSSSTDKEFILDQKLNQQNYRYKIVARFNSSDAALIREIKLHNLFNVASNIKFYNKANSHSTKFGTSGTVTVKGNDGKYMQMSVNDPRYISGEFTVAAKNRILVLDKLDKCYLVNKDDPRYLSGEFKFIHNNTTLVKDIYGNLSRIKCDDSRLKTGEFISAYKNTIVVKDKNNKNFRIDINDSRYLSGEVKSVRLGTNHSEETLKIFSQQRKNTVVVKDSENNFFKVNCNDIRISTGELQYTSKDSKWYNNGEKELHLFEYNTIPDGYILGRLDHLTGKMWYNNGITQIKVYPDSEPSGYIRGMLPRKSKSF